MKGAGELLPGLFHVLSTDFAMFRLPVSDILAAELFDFFDAGTAIVFGNEAHFPGSFLIHNHRKFRAQQLSPHENYTYMGFM